MASLFHYETTAGLQSRYSKVSQKRRKVILSAICKDKLSQLAKWLFLILAHFGSSFQVTCFDLWHFVFLIKPFHTAPSGEHPWQETEGERRVGTRCTGCM